MWLLLVQQFYAMDLHDTNENCLKQLKLIIYDISSTLQIFMFSYNIFKCVCCICNVGKVYVLHISSLFMSFLRNIQLCSFQLDLQHRWYKSIYHKRKRKSVNVNIRISKYFHLLNSLECWVFTGFVYLSIHLNAIYAYCVKFNMFRGMFNRQKHFQCIIKTH